MRLQQVDTWTDQEGRLTPLVSILRVIVRPHRHGVGKDTVVRLWLRKSFFFRVLEDADSLSASQIAIKILVGDSIVLSVVSQHPQNRRDNKLLLFSIFQVFYKPF